jgi:Holliday junction resolvasome RuvABC endonuclease subunit
MIIVGIDPSLTNTGIAILEHGEPIRLARYGFPGHNGASYQARSRRVRKQVHDVTHHCLGADLVVIEEHPYAIRLSASEFDRSGLWHGIYGNLDHAKIPIAVVANTTAKKWITGKGNAPKSDIMPIINDWYADWIPYPIESDDIADALGLAAMGAHHYGDPMPFPVKPRHTTGLEAVQWPDTDIAATTNTPAS